MLRTYRSEIIRFRRTAVIGTLIMSMFTALITLLTFVGFEDAPGPGGDGGPLGTISDLASVDGVISPDPARWNAVTQPSRSSGSTQQIASGPNDSRPSRWGGIRDAATGDPRAAASRGGIPCPS